MIHVREKINKFDYIKIKNILWAKDTTKNEVINYKLKIY